MILIHILAMAVLILSGLWWGVKVSLCGLLTKQIMAIYHQPLPYPNFLKLKLTRHHGLYLLHKPHYVQQFSHYRITLDAGLFFFLELTAGSKKKKIIIFHDQIDKQQFWRMRVLEKIQKGL